MMIKNMVVMLIFLLPSCLIFLWVDYFSKSQLFKYNDEGIIIPLYKPNNRLQDTVIAEIIPWNKISHFALDSKSCPHLQIVYIDNEAKKSVHPKYRQPLSNMLVPDKYNYCELANYLNKLLIEHNKEVEKSAIKEYKMSEKEYFLKFTIPKVYICISLLIIEWCTFNFVIN